MALKPVGGKYEGVWVNELKNGDKSYYINYRDENNKPVKKLVGKNTLTNSFTPKDAYLKLIEIKYKLEHQEEFNTNRSKEQKIKLDDLWKLFFKYAKANKKSWLMDEQNYNKHIKPVFGNKFVKSIKALEIEEFKQKLFEKPLEAQTVKHQLVLMRTIINYAIKHDIITNFVNPLSKVKMPEIDNRCQAYLTKKQAKEILKILKNTHTLTYHLTIFLLYTGARFSEVTGAAAQKNKNEKAMPLLWSDVNFNNETIYFKRTKKGNERYIAINKKLLKTLKYLKKNKTNDMVISNSAKGIILRMPDYFMKAVEIVIPGNRKKKRKYRITAHSLRHTHASWLAEAGLDILQIKEQLGHRNIEMTMKYAHLIPNKRNKVTKALD